jgi:hypothetical protein
LEEAMKNDLSSVDVGDWIWTIQEGRTKIKDIKHDSIYSIVTQNGSYTLRGKCHNFDQYHSAFTEPPACFNAEPKPCEFKKGQRVLVRDHPSTPWKRRYFAKHENSKYWCYLGGDEWSSCGETVDWENCKPWEVGND